MNHFRFFTCLFYGFVAIAQTLNNRFLFRTLQFKYYSTIFFIQRIAILIWGGTKKIQPKLIMFVIPYAISTCTVNILSSYCMTVMPLAAFMAFKKFVPVFAIGVGVLMKIPNQFTKYQSVALFLVVFGGIMIGEKDILKGNINGYAASLLYTLMQALGLQYSVFLYQKYQITPRDLMYMNSVLSMPYYILSLLYNRQYQEIFNYFTRDYSIFFYQALIFSIPLCIASQYTGKYWMIIANIIAMKVSPFDKASVSNIKDLILTILSVRYFKDIILTFFSQIGIFFCLVASLAFSFSLSSTPKNNKEYKQLQNEQISDY